MATQRGDRWQANVRHGGKLHRQLFDSRAEATAWESQVKAARERGEPLPELPEKYRTTSGDTLRGFVDEHFDLIWGQNKSAPKTKTLVNRLLDYFDERHPGLLVSAITEDHVDAYITYCSSELENSAKTLNRKSSALSKILKMAVRRKKLDALPEMPRFKEGKGRVSYLDRDTEYEEVRTWFMENGYTRNAYLLQFLCYSGVRPGHSECESLRWRHYKDGRLSLPDGKTGPRTIPLSRPAIEALEWLKRQGTDEIFVMPYSRYGKDWRVMRKALGRTDDPDFTPYISRHTCASWLAIAGVDIKRIKEFMGHANIKTTENYIHLAPDALDQCADALN